MVDRRMLGRRLQVGLIVGMCLAAASCAGMKTRRPTKQEREHAIAVAREYLASGQLELNESDLNEAINNAPDWVGFYRGMFKINWRLESGTSIGVTVVGDSAVGCTGPTY